MARRETVRKSAVNPGIAQLANSYVTNLQKIGAGQQPRGKFASAMSAAAATPSTDFGDFAPVEQPDSGGVGQWILDMLTRPLAAVAGGAYAQARNINILQGDRRPDEILNPFSEAWKGFIGDEKKTFSDVVGESLTNATIAGAPVEDIKPFTAFSNTPGMAALRLVQPQVNGDAGPSAKDMLSGVAGLGLDLTFDPVNLIAGPVGKGAQLVKGVVKGAGKGREIAQALTPVRKVTGISPVSERLAASPRPENITPAEAGIPDKIVESANVPLDPAIVPTNQVRKAGEVTTVDNFSMGSTLQDLTGKASKSFDAAERAKPRRPSWINEINPDEYVDAVNFVRGGDFIKPQHLVDWFDNVDIKKAQRFLSMMEKDGIIESSAQAGKRIGRKPHAYITRNVINKGQGVDDLNLMINQAPVTDQSRAAAIYDQVMPEMRAHFDDLENKGIQPKVQSTDGKGYTLSTSDILESLPRASVEQLNFGATGKANLYPSQWHAGAAQAVRMNELGVARDVAVDEVTRAMRAALRGNASRKTAIESTGNLSRAAEALVEHSDELAARITVNAKKFGTKNTIDTNAIVQTKLDDMDNALSGGSTGDAISAVANIGQDVAKNARAIGATDDAAVASAQQIAPEVAKRVPEADARFARAAVNNEHLRVREGFGPQADEKVIRRLNDLYVVVKRDVEQIAKDMEIGDIVLGQKHALTMNGFMDKLLHPLRNAFEYGYRTDGWAHFWRTGATRAEDDQTLFRRALRDLSKKHGENIIPAWTALRRMGIPSDPQVYAAYTDLQGVWNHVFGNGLRGRFFRNGASIDAINSALDEVGVSYRFKIPTNAQNAERVPEQALDWDIKEPLSDLERINKAALLIETRQTVAASFASNFGSSVPKPGYVRLNFAKGSKLGPHVDRSLYYPREAGEAIYQLDRLVSATNQVNTQTNIGKIVHLMDSVMRVWKPFMTIARPGFISRNLMSDIIMGTFNGVFDPSSYTTAAKSLSAAGEFTNKAAGIQGISKLRDGNYVSGAGVALMYRGKPITYQGLYKLAHDNGLMMSWHSTEDIAEMQGSFAEKLMDNPYMRAMGKANEVEGQFVRLAHFTDLLKRNMSVEKAAMEVRKYHPDVHGLTPFESKYMRRVFPFYTWLRQAIPVVFSTIVSKPGRVTSVFKAEYNAAVAMGVNPDSVIDPFPDDKLYPSFIRDNLVGPIVGDYGVNLGTPAEGVLQDVLQGNPARNIAGMVTPIVKAPIELASRQNLGTGGNIADVSDYIDSQLPIVNQVANISGYSVTGLGAPQRAVEMGEKEHFFNTQMINFLTGLGIQNYGKPSYRRYAAREADIG